MSDDMIKMATRQYWDARPCNLRHSNEPPDSLLYSWEVTARKYTVEPHILDFAEHKTWCRMSVLDLGCGIGTDSLQFARYGATVAAVDFSQDSIDILIKRAKAEKQDWRILTFVGDIEELPETHFHRECVDLVWSFGVLHHTPNPIAALKRAYEIARPGGELRFMVYHRWSWKALWILATYGKFRFWKWQDLIQQYSEAQTGCPYTRTYTRNGARKLAEKAGWKVYRTQVAHIFPYRVEDYKEGKLVKEWYWRLMPRPIFALLERLFGWHLLVWARKEGA